MQAVQRDAGPRTLIAVAALLGWLATACGNDPPRRNAVDGAPDAAADAGVVDARPPRPAAPVPLADRPSDCVVERRQDSDVSRITYRLGANPRELLAETPQATRDGLRPSVYFHHLDDRDRLLEKGQRIGELNEWRHRFTLDERGNPTLFVYEWQRAESGRIEQVNHYNAAGQLERTEWINGTGNQTSVSGRVTTFRYDQAGRLEVTIDTYADGRTIATNNTFDAEGRLATVTLKYGDTTALVTSYEYRADGRLGSRKIDGSLDYLAVDGIIDQLTEWSYDAAGIRASYLEGAISDLRGPPVVTGYSPGCEALRGRFPAIFRQPGGPAIVPP